MTTLQTIALEIQACTLCPLAKSRTRAVPGEGASTARLMFIGEAPGKEEDVQGKPFVGRAGKVLDRALLNAGLRRSDVFITNVVKCRPPHNRVPTKGEIDICVNAHLHRQLQTIEPDIVCLLGVTAVRALLGIPRLTTVRGRSVETDHRYFVTYHPAAAGRNPTWNQAFQMDIRELKRLLADRPRSRHR